MHAPKQAYFILLLINALVLTNTSHAYDAPFAAKAPSIDGVASEQVWSLAPWEAINHVIIDNTGEGAPTATDYKGKFKVVWTPSHLYLLAEISDQHFSDTYANPLDNWWNEDTLEIFIDENKSGGIHGGPDAKPQQEYNAFAYHIGIDNQVVDVGPNANGKVTPQLYNDHIKALWRRDPLPPHNIIWELKISVHDDTWRPAAPEQTPIKLHSGKRLGFMVSVIDADGADREHFMGSVDVPDKAPHGKNWGWIDASVFGELNLQKDKGG